MNRRVFLKGIIGSGLYSVMPASLGGYLQDMDKCSVPLSQSNIHIEIPRGKRIFCQVENQQLETEIERCAHEIGCEVLYGEPFSQDLLALGGFIYILDRNFVGRLWWDQYISICNEYEWHEPCIIVDTIKNQKLPKSNIVRQIDLTDTPSIENILHVIKETRAQNLMKNRLVNMKI